MDASYVASSSVERAKLLVSINNLKIRTSDGFRYPLTKRFLYLYFYLALKKVEEGSSGFVAAEDILLLPLWERNSVASVGKQIRRHILEMERIGRNIIEAQQKIYGPFRLSIPADQIQIDVPIHIVMDVLDLRHISRLDASQESNFYIYVEVMWEGNANFDNGVLDKAFELFKQASETAINSELEVAALHKMGVTLERLGNYEEALKICQRILGLEDLNKLEEATALILQGWIKIRQRELSDAEKLYNQALDIIRGRGYYKPLGDIYNGLGLIRKGRGEYYEALTFYQRAMEYWSLVDYFYGIQACYFNIGNLYSLWGDLETAKQKNGKSANYSKALEWTMRCKSLCEKIGIAYDTSQDHILLARLHVKSGEMDKALEYATTALKIAEEAGNKRDIAYSNRILGKIYVKLGSRDLAKSAFRTCIRVLKKTGASRKELKEREDEIQKILMEY